MSAIPSSPSAPPYKAGRALDPALFSRLPEADRRLLVQCEESLRLSFQQLKQLGEWLVDARMWREEGFPDLARRFLADLGIPAEGPAVAPINARQAGDGFFRHISAAYAALAGKPKRYPEKAAREVLPAHVFRDRELKGRILRLCPAASEKAVCCNLKTLSIVDNCAMACSYCVLQNHYDRAEVAVPTNLRAKLGEIRLQPEKRYRIGTGEYSDSLLWGNRNGILKDLCDFAAAHPNIILELKTKSANVGWLLENAVPRNVCASWSLNPQIIVANEEHKTASLDRRLRAARSVADKGVKVAFHFHPMFYFEGWEEAYRDLIAQVMALFAPGEVLWVSLGCVTLLRGFAQELRRNFRASKLLQMRTESSPDGKLTYAFDIRERLYRNALEALDPWHGRVFRYLCMEHAPMWEKVMGFAYPDMGAFDEAFNDAAFSKL